MSGVCAHREMTVLGHSEMVVGCKPRGEISGETKPTNTLILDLQPLGWWEGKFQLFKPVCGILLLVKYYSHQLINPLGGNLDNKIEEIPLDKMKFSSK